jgi:hypothetical protein
MGQPEHFGVTQPMAKDEAEKLVKSLKRSQSYLKAKIEKYAH